MNKRVSHPLAPSGRWLLRLAAYIALPLLMLGAQAPQSAGGTKLTYETVSVHSCKTGSGMSFSVYPDRLSARCTTLWGLIYNAFDVRPNDPIPGLPLWAESAPFDVEAKMDDNTLATLRELPGDQRAARRQQMLQTILADRFMLVIHHEVKERPIYALVIAKGGPKLTPDENMGGISWGRGRIQMRGGPIQRFAFTLSDVLGRVVVNRTGLDGKYDIDLRWTPDDQQGSADAGPSIFTAIDEQLGLKLESSKGPVDTIVVDHVERPSEN